MHKIKSLSVEGLSALFDGTPIEKCQTQQGLTNAEKKRREKERKAKAFEELKAALKEAAEEINHWLPSALGIVFYETRCNKCGSMQTIPELHCKDEALVRYTHKLTKQVKWTRTPFRSIPQGLPEHTVILSAKTHRCMSCVQPVEGLVVEETEELKHLPQPSGVPEQVMNPGPNFDLFTPPMPVWPSVPTPTLRAIAQASYTQEPTYAP